MGPEMSKEEFFKRFDPLGREKMISLMSQQAKAEKKERQRDDAERQFQRELVDQEKVDNKYEAEARQMAQEKFKDNCYKKPFVYLFFIDFLSEPKNIQDEFQRLYHIAMWQIKEQLPRKELGPLDKRWIDRFKDSKNGETFAQWLKDQNEK